MSEWSDRYPTEPGFYWVRNYLRDVDELWKQYQIIERDAVIVEVDDSLDFFWTGSEVAYRKADLILAEWYGPIVPPGAI